MPQSPRAGATRRHPPSPISPSQTLQQHAFRGPPSPKRDPASSIQGKQRQGVQLGTAVDQRSGHAFSEDSTPLETNRNTNNDDGEDPHDLAFSPQHVMRTSIVDNMVLSLDQFANPSMSVYEDRAKPSSRSSGLEAGARRGHTHSSSASSEGDGRDHRAWPQHNVYSSRVVRRNSAAKFSRQKLPSIFGEDEESTRVKVYDAQRATRPPKVSSRSYHSGKGATGSASSSIDLSHLSGLRLGAPGDRRSRSFDFGSRRPSDMLSRAPDPIDVAPTPVIYPGPEAQNSPIKQSFTGFPVRRNSNKSSRSMHTKVTKSTVASGDMFRATENDPIPTVPIMKGAPALASVLSEGKNAPSPSLDITLLPRPGFFRRMFSSSRTQSSPEMPPHLPPESSARAQNPNVAEQTVLAAAQLQQARSNIYRPSTELVPSKDNQPVVGKKSSFFRRRKKSMSTGPPPPLPLNVTPNTVLKGETSPVSSLRALMDPFLADAHNGSGIPARLSDEQPGYHDAQSAVHPVDNEIRGLSDRISGDVVLNTPRPTKPPLQIPGSKSSSRLRVPLQESFFEDTSSTEGRSTSSTGPRSVVDSALPEPINRSPAVSLHKLPANVSSSVNVGFSRPSVSTQSTTRRTEKKVGLPTHLSATAAKAVARPQPRPELRTAEAGSKTAGVDVASSAPPDSPQASVSDVSEYRSATSTPMVPEDSVKDTLRSPAVHVSHPSLSHAHDEGANQARRIFNNDDPHVDPADASAWLGENGAERAKVRNAYMELFDWTGLNILAAMRGLCDRIALKGETQQVDRMLDAFARRWCDCNYNHGFKSDDVVHTICYSLLLLNTDLHLADIGQKMTRAQFVRNALPTIKRVANSAESRTTNRSPSPAIQSGSTPSAATPQRQSVDLDGTPTPSFGRPVDRLTREDSGDLESAAVASGPLVDAPYLGSERGWEQQIETVLKSFYSSVSRQRLPLYGAVDDSTAASVSGGLLSLTGNMLRRTPSTVSKAHSDTSRGRLGSESRSLGARFTAKARSRPRLATTLGFSSSRTSLDEQSSAWSPAMSSTWSKASLGKTLTSISVDSFGSEAVKPDYMSSIGFANALSQAIVRDDQLSAALDEGLKMGSLLDDESLELCGAPWAKEGMLKHKCHLDGVDKRSKDRQWTDCFAVIDKGWMRLFSFSMNARTIRQKAKSQKAGGVVGGGNWQDNAEEIGRFMLRHTIASSLPPPGYSKARPWVWALSLPTGAVHLFSVGTPDIVKEFVSTANYWSARLSKEPMMGGISNMEYGWSDDVMQRTLVTSESQPGLNIAAASPRPSTQMSIRSSIDHGNGTVRPKLPGDKIHINDWQPPQQSMMASQLLEVDQLRALQAYVQNVEEELSKHNELRPAMTLAFSPKHPNSGRAMGNWEKKSSYLLREIVKFRTYIDSLQNGQTSKERVYAMRREDEENSRQASDVKALAAAMNWT